MISLVLFSLILFFLLVLFKVNGSSIPLWDDIIIERNEQRISLLAGRPKWIRSDEWLIYTPFILSQYFQGFPVKNEALGGGNVPMIMNLPVYHYTLLFKPQYWGLFIFDVERGFSFYWNFKIFILFTGFFFLLMLLTKNNFSLSLFGAIWLYLSSYIQWWFSSPASMPEMIGSFCIIFISSIYLFCSKRKITIILSAIFFIIFSLNFFLCLYIPFQICLIYLLAILSTGYFLSFFNKEIFNLHFHMRIVSIFLALFITFLIIFLFVFEIKDNIPLISGTIYPGHRISSGGALDFARYFSGFYDLFYSENSFPARWGNVCEASNFILLYPFVLLLIIRNFFYRKYSLLELSLVFYVLIFSVWILSGFYPIFAKIFLFSRLPSNRALFGLGIGSIILVIVFLSNNNTEKYNFLQGLLVFIPAFIILFFYGLLLKSVDPFFTIVKVLISSILFAIICSLSLSRKRLIFYVAVFIMLIPGIFINPVSVGLGPVFDKTFSEKVLELSEKNPDAGWVVFGDFKIAGFLQAMGVNVLNGTKAIPDLKLMKSLDEGEEYREVYNRYAHIRVEENKEIEDEKEVEFALTVPPTHFTMFINPASEKLKDIDVKYFVFTYIPDREDARYFIPLFYDSNNDIWICEYNFTGNFKDNDYEIFMDMISKEKPEHLPPVFSGASTLFAIDTINDIVCSQQKGPIIFTDIEKVTVTGWAVDDKAKDVAGDVYIDIDGVLFQARYGILREDVAEAFNIASYKYSGFICEISADSIGKGKHLLSIKILSKDRETSYDFHEKILFDIK